MLLAEDKDENQVGMLMFDKDRETQRRLQFLVPQLWKIQVGGLMFDEDRKDSGIFRF